MKIRVLIFSLIIISSFIYQPVMIQAQDQPIISLDQTAHSFPAVFEGEILSHTFTILNKGTAVLNIEKVTHT